MRLTGRMNTSLCFSFITAICFRTVVHLQIAKQLFRRLSWYSSVIRQIHQSLSLQ